MKTVPFKIGIVLLIISLLCGCRSGFHYSKNDTTPFKRSIVIDSTSTLYIRTLYTKENKYDGRELTTKEKDSTGTKNFLVEVQFLIFNKNGQVIYISTIPSKYIFDKADTYLLKSKSGRTKYPNSFFFNSFFIGQYHEETSKIEFNNTKTGQEWNLSFRKEAWVCSLLSINNYSYKKVRDMNKDIITQKVYLSTEVTDESFSNPVEFKKTKYFEYLSFRNPYDSIKKGTLQRNNTILKANEICIYFEDAAMKKVSHVIIPFSDFLKPDFKNMKFKSGRVRYF